MYAIAQKAKTMDSGTSVYDADVFVVTDTGDEEIKSGWTRLAAREIELLVVLDGKTSLADASTKIAGSTKEQMRAAAVSLLAAGHIKPATIAEELDLDFSYFFNDRPGSLPPPDAPDAMRLEAENGAVALKIDGYYVSIAKKALAPAAPVVPPAYTVLIVEDTPELQANLSMLLRMEGFKVRQARNRDEILAQLRTPPVPDVTLLDVTLPGANGFDILAKVRQHPQLKAMRIIMLTGLASREDVLRGLAGGANGYITKPFDREALLAGIKAVLGLHVTADVRKGA